jgi:hypothetical protein
VYHFLFACDLFLHPLSDSFIFLTLTRLVVVLKLLNFRFTLFTPPLGDFQTAVLNPLRNQGDVSKDPTAVLPQGSDAPPTATTSHEQGAKTSPTATSACT